MGMNLDEIARLSGVSRTTVSRVLNNKSEVKEATRQRVLEIIRQSNFKPHAAARSLAGGRTRVLGVVILVGVSELFSWPYFSLLIQGITAACRALDYSVMLWLAEPGHERRTLAQILRSGLIDGLVISSMLVDNPIVPALEENNTPFLLIGRHPTNPQANYVDVENLNGARKATAHLLRLGRRRVATINGPLNIIAGADRHEGYLVALRDRGLPVDSNLIRESNFTEAGGYHAMQQLLPYAPDAVFAGNDLMALGALQALREAGRRVPEDLALVGFDDVPFAASTVPALTTVRQPIQQAGQLSAEMLIDLIENPQLAPQQLVLPTELVIRASCGFELQNALPA